MTTINFQNEELSVRFHNYLDNKRTCLKLVDINGLPYATATVNMPDIKLKQDEVIIKDYGENTGMLYSLVKAGVVSNPIDYTSSGYVVAPICKLLVKE